MITKQHHIIANLKQNLDHAACNTHCPPSVYLLAHRNKLRVSVWHTLHSSLSARNICQVTQCEPPKQKKYSVPSTGGKKKKKGQGEEEENVPSPSFAICQLGTFANHPHPPTPTHTLFLQLQFPNVSNITTFGLIFLNKGC